MVWMVWLQQPLPPSQARPSPAPSCGGPARPVIFFFCLRAPTSIHRLPLFTIIPRTNTTTVHAAYTYSTTIYCYFCSDFIYYRLPPPASSPSSPGTHPRALFGFRAQQGTRHRLPLPLQGQEGTREKIDKRDQSPYRTPGLVDTQPAACKKKVPFPG